MQFELAPLSASNMYTVSCLGPAARIVPNLLCLVVTFVPLPPAELDALELVLPWEYGLLGEDAVDATAPPELGFEALLDDDELLPHAAADRQPRVSKAIPIVLLTKASRVF